MAESDTESNPRPAVATNDNLMVSVEDFSAEYRPGDEPVFGRGATIDMDDNPALSRRLGRFMHVEGWWWLQNLGSKVVLQVLDPASGAASRVPPRTQLMLVHPLEVVRFEVGRARYELRVEQTPRRLYLIEADPSDDGTETIDLTNAPINDEQRLMLVALCEPRLRDPLGPLRMPSNQDVADRLGWSLTKLNRKLDWLCDRLARQGLSGMKEIDGRAVRRRERLVEHAIDSGLVSPHDLAALDGSV